MAILRSWTEPIFWLFDRSNAVEDSTVEENWAAALPFIMMLMKSEKSGANKFSGAVRIFK